MPKGEAVKGYKMTQNRQAILELLVEEGGSLRSQDGRATGLMLGLLPGNSSQVSLNASLREMENLGWINRHIDGRRTFEIAITDLGRKVIGAEPAAKSRDLKIVQTAVDVPPPAELPPGPAADWEQEQEEPAAAAASTAAPAAVPSAEWDWDTEKPALPGDIDYDILLAVFLKAALRGMEGPSNGELDYMRQQYELAQQKISVLEADVNKFRSEAAHAIAERDQLQKNLNIIMAKADKKGTRGSNPVRSLLSPEERDGLDALIRQMPTAKGD